jgi:hypothetical protein
MRIAGAADPVPWTPSQRARRRRRAVRGSSVEVTSSGLLRGSLMPHAFETEPARLGRFCPEQSRCRVARCAAQARSRVRRTLALGAGAKPASSSSGRSARGTRRRLRIDAAYRARAGSRGDVDRLLELQDAISGVLADSYAEQHRARRRGGPARRPPGRAHVPAFTSTWFSSSDINLPRSPSSLTSLTACSAAGPRAKLSV